MENNSKSKAKETFSSVFVNKTESAFDMFLVTFVESLS